VAEGLGAALAVGEGRHWAQRELAVAIQVVEQAEGQKGSFYLAATGDRNLAVNMDGPSRPEVPSARRTLRARKWSVRMCSTPRPPCGVARRSRQVAPKVAPAMPTSLPEYPVYLH
jgi:hypothetical protein